MAYKYLEHKADTILVGIGNTLEEAFEEAAKALFDLMVDIKKVECKEKVVITADANAEDLLFVEWLNRLLAEKDIKEMMFSSFKIEKIKKQNQIWMLKAVACGEKFDPERHSPKTEVKAATYSGLKVGKKGAKFYVQCVCDV